MIIRAIQFTLLNHLFYYTEVSGGATSASITGAFIGDLALNYAFKRALIKSDDAYPFRQKPEYEEIKNFGYYSTVARPLNIEHLTRTESYIRSTSFNSDGYSALGSSLPYYNAAAKSPFKTFRQVQGIALGSKFISLFLSENSIELPETIRVGTTKETLLKVEELVLSKCENDFWLNAFTLKTVFENLEQTVNILAREGKVNFSYILENYALIKNLSFQNIEEIFQNSFSNG